MCLGLRDHVLMWETSLLFMKGCMTTSQKYMEDLQGKLLKARHYSAKYIVLFQYYINFLLAY